MFKYIYIYISNIFGYWESILNICLISNYWRSLVASFKSSDSLQGFLQDVAATKMPAVCRCRLVGIHHKTEALK